MIPPKLLSKNKEGNTNEILGTIKGIENFKINVDNYEDFVLTINKTCDMLSFQIKGLVETFSIAQDQHNELNKTDDFLRARETNIVPLEVYECLLDAYKNLKEINTLKFLQSHMYKIGTDKLSKLFQTVDALEIRKEALQEHRDLTKSSTEFMKDVLNNKLEIVNDKFLATLNKLESNAETSFKNNTNAYLTIIDKINNNYLRFLDKMYSQGNVTKDFAVDEAGDMGKSMGNVKKDFQERMTPPETYMTGKADMLYDEEEKEEFKEVYNEETKNRIDEMAQMREDEKCRDKKRQIITDLNRAAKQDDAANESAASDNNDIDKKYETVDMPPPEDA